MKKIHLVLTLSYFVILLQSKQSALAKEPVLLDTVFNTAAAPYSKICFLEISRKKYFLWNSVAYSTGFFIAPNIVLTAAHNIYSWVFSRVEKIKIIPAKNDAVAPFDSLEIDDVNKPAQIIVTHPDYTWFFSSGDRSYDYGVIVIPDSILDKNNKLAETQLFEIDSSFRLITNTVIHIAGYPSDNEQGYTGRVMTHVESPCIDVVVEGKKINYDLNTYGGNSGSPVWVLSNGSCKIIGVHTDLVGGAYFDAENYIIVLKWLEKYKRK